MGAKRRGHGEDAVYFDHQGAPCQDVRSAAAEEHQRKMNDYRIAEGQRQTALTAAQHNAEREQLTSVELETLAEHAQRVSAELTPRYTKGLSVLRSA
jgi:hypothetical protein